MCGSRARGENLKEVNSEFLEWQMKKHERQIRFLFAAHRDNFGRQIASFGLIL